MGAGRRRRHLAQLDQQRPQDLQHHVRPRRRHRGRGRRAVRLPGRLRPLRSRVQAQPGQLRGGGGRGGRRAHGDLHPARRPVLDHPCRPGHAGEGDRRRHRVLVRRDRGRPGAAAARLRRPVHRDAGRFGGAHRGDQDRRSDGGVPLSAHRRQPDPVHQHGIRSPLPVRAGQAGGRRRRRAQPVQHRHRPRHHPFHRPLLHRRVRARRAGGGGAQPPLLEDRRGGRLAALPGARHLPDRARPQHRVPAVQGGQQGRLHAAPRGRGRAAERRGPRLHRLQRRRHAGVRLRGVQPEPRHHGSAGV